MGEATISVIIPVYNGERYLGDAIASVLAQTVPVHEIIVVDDGSTDGSLSVAERFGASVRCHRQANAGAGAARNGGVALAGGEFLAFLDADDLWTPDKLRRQLAAFADDPEQEMVFGHLQQFHSPELTAEERRGCAIRVAVMPGYHAGSMLIKTAAFHRVGLYNPNLRIGEFIDWHARAMDVPLKSHLLPEIVVKRRLHQSNLGVVARDQRSGYLHALKASLDRRRANAS